MSNIHAIIAAWLKASQSSWCQNEQVYQGVKCKVSDLPEKKHYDYVCFDVISVMRGWVGGYRISRKKRYVSLE